MPTETTDRPGPVELLGARFHPWSMDETVAEIRHRLLGGNFVHHVVVNVAKIVNMRRDPSLRNSVHGADIVNADGMGVVWGARLLGIPVRERVAGIDLFFRLLAVAEREGWGIYLCGSKQATLDRAITVLVRRYPDLRIKGSHHGYFSADEEQKVVDDIRRSDAMMLFVAMSSPNKEEFIARWHESLGVRFAMGIGGTLDIVAGVTTRAPLWMQRCGLEWFYRLIQEPRRMARRYFVSNSVFAWLLLRTLVTRWRGRLCAALRE